VIHAAKSVHPCSYAPRGNAHPDALRPLNRMPSYFLGVARRGASTTSVPTQSVGTSKADISVRTDVVGEQVVHVAQKQFSFSDDWV
jgi:hypothetical protein